MLSYYDENGKVIEGITNSKYPNISANILRFSWNNKEKNRKQSCDNKYSTVSYFNLVTALKQIFKKYENFN